MTDMTRLASFKIHLILLIFLIYLPWVYGESLQGEGSNADDPKSTVFTFTGTPQTITIPAGVGGMKVTLYGASGAPYNSILGGGGGKILSIVPVAEGEIYLLYVGGTSTDGTPGYNGGGSGATAAASRAGGGATDLRKSPYTLYDRILVAGGGGGGSCSGPPGGDGGYPSGLTTWDLPWGSSTYYAGKGGTATAGGAFGAFSGGDYLCPGGNAGTFGQGGAACDDAGGGGGYYGGGGAHSSGGGGGSSYSLYAVTDSTGTNSGNGFATIEYLPKTTTIAYTGAPQSVTVPAGVSAMIVTLYGASGAPYGTTPGGAGGRITSTVPVSEGDIYQLFVGGTSTDATPGYNGGGAGATAAASRAGGGATDLRKSPYTLYDRILVAGGGGGGSCSGPHGGDGGYPEGLTTWDLPWGSSTYYAGKGGTATAGGAFGAFSGGDYLCPGGNSGSFGQGGAACDDAGGGGGYYGGGGAHSSGGGGGSSYSLYAVTNSTGTNVGNGFATIEYVYGITAAPPTPVPSSSPSAVPSALPSQTPSALPSQTPSALPSQTPSALPSQTPSALPSQTPTEIPTVAPTAVPSGDPTGGPTGVPTAVPTAAPSAGPTTLPTVVPTSVPTEIPSAAPTAVPSASPSAGPTAAPSAAPSAVPSAAPTAAPSASPSAGPTAAPTTVPSAVPSAGPTSVPTTVPTAAPTASPSSAPTANPSAAPTSGPTNVPTGSPTASPSAGPTAAPSADPSAVPSAGPTVVPTAIPSADPTAAPTEAPTADPTTEPTIVPSAAPTAFPSADPTADPTTGPSEAPTAVPSADPTADPTMEPSEAPTAVPSADPSAVPTTAPTAQPSAEPTANPTVDPSASPTEDPTAEPSTAPTTVPTASPTADPSADPTMVPTASPTADPSANPSANPTVQPSADPTASPSEAPTARPTALPTASPTDGPTTVPTAVPSAEPTAVPSAVPTAVPTVDPTSGPSADPSADPTSEPTADPTVDPTAGPTIGPSVEPTVSPTENPTTAPSAVPTTRPSLAPSAGPTTSPTVVPTPSPTSAPTAKPTQVPSCAPTQKPSTRPTASPTMIPSAAPTVLNASPPVVHITSTAQSLTSVNTEQKLSLSGSVSVMTSCTALWSTERAGFSLAASALSPISTQVPDNSAATIYLVLGANALPARASLVFTLTCGTSAESVVVTTNGPPVPGGLTVLPTSGTELSTPFAFATSGWSDADLPITYQLGFVSPSSGASMVVRARSELTTGTSTLPAGSSTLQNQILCFVQAFDALNSAANITTPVVVTRQADVTQVQSAISSLLTASAGDVDATKNAISVGVSVLNAVSCTNAPDCASRKREGCAKTQDTCGTCLAGYIGVAGDSNFECLSPETIKASASTSHACASNADCNSWEECALYLAAPVCTLPVKKCPDGCSVHGSCVLLDVQTRKQVLDCKSDNPTCEATCVCSEGYFGASCSVSQDSLSSMQQVRSQLIAGLTDVAASDTASADTLSSWTTSLSALAQDPYQLSASAAATVNSLSLSIISKAAELDGEVSYESLEGLLGSVDAAAIASGKAAPGAASMDATDILQTVSQFGDLVQNQLFAGQAAVDYLYASFRSSSATQLVRSDAPFQVTAPQSFSETAFDLSPTGLTVDSVDNEEVAITLITSSTSLYGEDGSSFNANPVRVQVSRSSSSPTTVTLFLPHHSAVEFTNETYAASLVFNTSCTGVDDQSVHHHTCPMSGAVLENRCEGRFGYLTSYCPVLGPSCSVKDAVTGAFSTSADACSVVDSTELYTKCSCTIRPDPARRRLADALQESGVMDLVATSGYVANQFVGTFQSAGDLNSAADFQRVLIVIVMFASLWAGGLLLIFGCAWRKKAMETVNKKEQSQLNRKVQSAEVSRSPAAVRQYLMDYVATTLPSVFSDKPFFSRLYGEVQRHHRYLMLFTAPSGEAGDKERILTCVELLSVQTMLMFLLALLYDVQGPADDGSCGPKLTEESCLHRRSPMDSSQTYCQWSSDTSSGDFTCTYQEPQFSIQVVIYLAVLVALLVALISYPVDKIFELLSAPTADEAKVASEEGTLQRMGRRASNVARRASAVAGNLVNAAQVATMRVLAGSTTRKIPAATESAHALASASMTVIAEKTQFIIQSRQLSRMRSYYASGGKFGKKDVDYSSSSSDESDSESDAAETTRRVESASGAAATGNLGASVSRSDAADVEETLHALEEQVHCQRRYLKPSELELFDAQWGMDPSGEFTSTEKSVIPCFSGKPGSEELIRRELQYVKAETEKRADKLRMATDTHTGLEILHLFINDLLGRNTSAARIFETKSREDFKYTKVVTKNTKRLAVLALIAVNVFFVYYALLTGFRRGLSWQRMYLVACIMQFIVEIFLFETMECMWVNCAVPLLVSEEVRQVNESLMVVVQELCSGAKMDCDHFLNAPDYLFVSTNVAKKFPQLMESILVQAYSSHMPGELAKTWQVGSVARIQRHQQLRRTTLLAVVLATLQYLGTAPFIFHRMFIRFVQPFVFSGIVLLWRLIIADTESIIISCAVLAAAVGYALCRRCTERPTAESRRVMAEYEENGTAVHLSLAPEVGEVDNGALHTPKRELPLLDSTGQNRNRVRASGVRSSSVGSPPEGEEDEVSPQDGIEEKESASEQEVGVRARSCTDRSTDGSEHRKSLLSVLDKVRAYGSSIAESDSISVGVRKRFMSIDSDASGFAVSDSSASSSTEDGSV